MGMLGIEPGAAGSEAIMSTIILRCPPTWVQSLI